MLLLPLHIGPKVLDFTDIIFRDIVPTFKLIVYFEIFFSLFRSPHGFHALFIQRFGFSEIPNIELVLRVLMHVSNSEVEPLLVPSSVGVLVYE